MEKQKNSVEEISAVCNSVKKVLIKKNIRYGNSALSPIKVFSKFDNNLDSILVRLDDKLSRIKNADVLRKNDVFDLVGYLLLYCVGRKWDNFEDLID